MGKWCDAAGGEGTGVRLVDAGMPVTEIRWRDNRTVIIPTIYTLTHKPKAMTEYNDMGLVY